MKVVLDTKVIVSGLIWGGPRLAEPGPDESRGVAATRPELWGQDG